VTAALLPFLCVVLSLGIGQSERPSPAQSAVSCQEWQACRDLAERARANGDYESFHDLAWRAVQTRGRRDPELFLLLARAQALSGRPHDALVTLRRLATELGYAADVAEDPDFRRVRALAGWPDTAAAIAALAKPATAEPARPSPPAPEPAAERPAAKRDARSAPSPPAAAAEPAGPKSPEASPFVEAAIAAEFQAAPFTAGGLAYDTVSGRFVIGNLPERKLTVVAEGSNRPATLSGDAAHLGPVKALAIDRSSGDLWVIASSLHKLQLISGRVLKVFAPAAGAGTAASLVDVAVSRARGVLALDAAPPRLLRPDARGDTLLDVLPLPEGTPTSLALGAGGRTAYVAYADRILQVDLDSGRATTLAAGEEEALAGFGQLRWHRGTLVGIQRTGNGTRLVRLRLRGRRVTRVEPMADPATHAPPTAFDIVGDTLFYLSAGDGGTTIRRVELR